MALRFVYNKYEFKFEDLLTKDGLFTVYRYNIQALAIELCKVYNNIFQITFWVLFARKNNGYYHSHKKRKDSLEKRAAFS